MRSFVSTWKTSMSLIAPDEARALEPPAVEALASAASGARRPIGLAGRLLALTIGSVLVAFFVFYVTRISNYRENWLRDRLVVAQTATYLFSSNMPEPLPADLTRKVLGTVGAKMIMLHIRNQEILLTSSDAAVVPDYHFDLTNPSFFEGVEGAVATLFAPRGSTLLVEGPSPMGSDRVEIAIDQTPLIDSMWRISENYLTLSLGVLTAAVLVLWAALWHMVIRPVRRLTSSIIAFGEKPQDAIAIARPSRRDDEIGRAEAALAVMQGSLAHELSQRKRLAELGMAVARINHDLRNMLAAAQLISDRLATIPDPLAQRLAPQLVATLDRAIQFCQSTLTYGAAREAAPQRRRFDLREVVRQVVETAEATGAGAILYAIDIPPNFELLADPDHVRRVIENLSRNAAQALQSQGTCGERPPAIRFAAIRTSEGAALIEVSDSGPGFALEQAEKIFEPFHRTTREGGSGLGLAIAADLVARNGGSIALAQAEPDDFYCGARFLITLPTPEDARKPVRAVAQV